MQESGLTPHGLSIVAGVVSGSFVLANGALKIAERAFDKRKTESSGQAGLGFTTRDRDALRGIQRDSKHLVDWHDRSDNSGRPLAYFPEDVLPVLQEQRDLLKELAHRTKD